MEGTVEKGQRKEKKGWWESRTSFQKNLVVGVVALGIISGLVIPLCLSSNDTNNQNKQVYKLENEEENKTSTSVIIIGSGASGIAAAAYLLEHNIDNVTILEGENRIGGRIQSVFFGDSIIDLGAQWCHGEKNNLVYELAGKLNLLEGDSLNKIAFYHSSLKYLDRTFVQQIFDIAADIYEGNGRLEAESTLGDYMLERFNTTLFENYRNNQKKITLAHEILNSFHLVALTMEGSFSWFDVAAQSDFEPSEGHHNLGWKGRGYKTILDVLVKKYPNEEDELPVYDKVILNKDVIKITTLDGATPQVICSDNTTYEADHVIFTPSLGVLKYGQQDLFEPPLPQEKVHAIETLGIAGVVKMFFYFTEKWWPKHVDVFTLIWSKRDAQNVWKEFPYGSKTHGISWLTSLTLITTNKYHPNVLSSWVTGEAVPGVEKIPDDIIINGTIFVLNKFLGHQFKNITRPEKIKREKWYSNKHFRGTYSFDTLESREDGISQRDILAQPLKDAREKPVVLFAGEATNRIHHSTVHGAIETGQREAKRILDYYSVN